MTSEIKALKAIGHDLLNDFIALDPNPKMARQRAYQSLSKSGLKHVHFSQMKTYIEVMNACDKLRAMIEKRKKSIKNSQVAPNVRELQKKANELNPQL
jgi:superoxide dismutase